MANPITNIVVVMLENRSYDNILGRLYNSRNAPPYDRPPPGQANLDGLSLNETNPNPYQAGPIRVGNQTTPTRDPKTGRTYPPTTIPIFDPNEPFADMAQQLLGLPAKPTRNPWIAPTYPPTPANACQGFTTNYRLRSDMTAANIADVMNYFTPAQLATTATLARVYAVCDRWYASIPTQTFSNRAFAHCAAPGVHKPVVGDAYSLIDDLQYAVHPLVELPSIFSRLDQVYGISGAPNWKVYFHDYSISVGTVPYVRARATRPDNVNVAPFDTLDWGTDRPRVWFTADLGGRPRNFAEDLTQRTLPKYAFIEPRYSFNWARYRYPSTSNHPGWSSVDGLPGENVSAIDTRDGESFLARVYFALRNSDYYWNRTLLIVTYDEPGGLYDHVVPPAATMPGPTVPPARNDLDPSANGFPFDVFGGRVPAIVVSPYIAPGSTIRPPGAVPFDHASIVKTVWECFNLSSPGTTSLTRRDAAAPSLMPFVNATAVNTAEPDIEPAVISESLPRQENPRLDLTVEEYVSRRYPDHHR